MRLWLIISLLAMAQALPAADWPQWRGADRAGVWLETGVLDKFPAEGLEFLWRTPVGAGYAGPAVAAGRVFVTDYADGVERLLALDERTGAVVWTVDWPADYTGLDYASGPRATPTVDGDLVYALGAAGELRCIQVKDGKTRWRTHYQDDLAAELPPWGFAAAPIVAGDLLIAVAAAQPDGKVVAFDKRTGREVWRALSATDSGPGYSQPRLIEVGGKQQLLVWHAGAVSSLDPQQGELLWEQPFRIRMETPIATPAWSEPHLLVSAFFGGARLFEVGSKGAEMVWAREDLNVNRTEGLHALMSAPILDGDYLYGLSSQGELRCFRLADGERVWETQAVTVERARNASAFFVRLGDRYFINNDRGELIIAKLSPDGYEELDRTRLIEPTSKPGAKRELEAVHWSHPAYANQRIYVRNDREIVSASLARK